MIEFADPKEWWLELSPMARTEATRQSQQCATLSSQYIAYLNGICLHSFLNWLREDVPEASAWLPLSDLPSIWEVVNGTAIVVETTRLILIPTEVMDDAELRVPQEWVDIPSWVGDYYLAVQVQPEKDWLRIWGYTTHQELKSLGNYDASDRTYALDAKHLTQDLNAFWATVQLCEAAETRSVTAPLPALASSQAENLVQRLGNSSIILPRLAVPFTLWGALLEREDWRNWLFQRRTGRETTNTVVRLREWLQGNIAATWQAIEAVILPQQLETASRSDATPQLSNYEVSRAKVLEFGSQPGEEQVALLVSISSVIESSATIGLQVCPTGENRLLPNAVQVRLLDGFGNEVGQASAAITETIQLQFEAELGERFRVEVTLGEKRITEEFEV